MLVAVLLLAGTSIFAWGVDSDKDGVRDKKDQCPQTPISARIDETGCPVDSDLDGIPDGIDHCSKTQQGWPVDAWGCPSDTDKDGVVDGQDSCADTPSGARVDYAGCPSDSDSDRVLDGLDRCDGTMPGYSVDGYGCPVDTDHDGVNDALDQCAGTRPRVTVDAGGCQVKSSPLFQPGVDKLRLEGLTFGKNEVVLPPESGTILMSTAASLKDWPDTRMEIGVHTDRAGSAATNLELSQRRAEYVKNYLVGLGIDEARLTAKGYGEKGPVNERFIELSRLEESVVQNR
jgi:outer membrane protein OmpA-like peptidoglycan-associated protein